MDLDSRAALDEIEDNDLANGTRAVVERIRPHLGTILLVVLVAFAAAAVWTLIRAQQAAQRTAAWDECLAALSEGDMGRLQDVVARYGGSAASQWAELVLADAALADGNRLVASDRDLGLRRLEEAAGRYTSVNSQGPKDLAAQRAILGLARTRESLGDLDEARRGYQALVDEHPDSAFRGLAEERIAALSRAGTERWYKWFQSRPAVAAPAAGVTAEPAAESPPADEPATPRESAEPAAAGEPAAAPAG